MKNTLRTQLEIIKMNEIKPNFSSLEREYGYDRRTIKKYYEGYGGKSPTRKRKSKLDGYGEEIAEKMQIKGVTISGVYQYIVKKYGSEKVGCYCNFYHYVRKHDYAPDKKVKWHPRYETEAGKQAQIDWKEEISLKSRNGEEYIFNIFNYKLGNSRYCHYVYKVNKRRQEVYESLIESFTECGGVPEEVLCDNMSSIVDIDGKSRKVNEKFRQFAKDFGFEVKLCKPRHSYTKGKVESNTKFVFDEFIIP
jgi:transposase